jgi:uncharacterized protein (TIGR03083 family)
VAEQPDPVPLTPTAYLPYLEQAAADFAAIVDAGDLDAPVPGCAPWLLRDLAQHLGSVHRWARAAVVEGRPDAASITDVPGERAALVAWFRDGADALLMTLRDTDPDARCWAFGPRPHTASFWFRRQAHETAFHAGDAAASQGAARPYGAELAVDGIDEVVGLMFPRQVRLDRAPAVPDALAVEPAEGGRWVLAGDGTGSAQEAAATVSGPAEALLLLLWHRTTLDDDRVSVVGPRPVAETVLGSALTP